MLSNIVLLSSISVCFHLLALVFQTLMQPKASGPVLLMGCSSDLLHVYEMYYSPYFLLCSSKKRVLEDAATLSDEQEAKYVFLLEPMLHIFIY